MALAYWISVIVIIIILIVNLVGLISLNKHTKFTIYSLIIAAFVVSFITIIIQLVSYSRSNLKPGQYASLISAIILVLLGIGMVATAHKLTPDVVPLSRRDNAIIIAWATLILSIILIFSSLYSLMREKITVKTISTVDQKKYAGIVEN